MNSPNTIPLDKKHLYDVGGKVVSLSQIQEALIEQSLYHELKAHIEGGK